MQIALGGAEQVVSVLDFEQSVRADTWDNEGKPHGAVYKRVRWIQRNYLRRDKVARNYIDSTKCDHRRNEGRSLSQRTCSVCIRSGRAP
jgi:hypothetical protein